MRADGNIYFTDTDWGARPGSAARADGRLPRLARRRAEPRARRCEKPNGIALSPDGGTLYIGSDTQAKVWRLPVDAGGARSAPRRRVLIDGARVPGGFKVPDGICVDDRGNLYVANNSDEIKAIEVFDAGGRAPGANPLPAPRPRTAASAAPIGGPST